MTRPVWLYVYDPGFLDDLAEGYAVASTGRRVHTLALPLDRRRDVRVGDRVVVWVRPAARSVYRSGLWGAGIVDRQPNGESDYTDRDWRDGRRKRWFVDIRFRTAGIVDAHHFADVDEPWRGAAPLAPAGLVGEVLDDFRSVCAAAGLPASMLALLGEPSAAPAAVSPPAEWVGLPEPIHQGARLQRLQWVAAQLSLPPAVIVEIRRRRASAAVAADVEHALRLPSGTVHKLAGLEVQAARRFPPMVDPAPVRPRAAAPSTARRLPAQPRPAQPRPAQLGGAQTLRRPSRPPSRTTAPSRGDLPSLSALCQACGLVPSPLTGKCNCV